MFNCMKTKKCRKFLSVYHCLCKFNQSMVHSFSHSVLRWLVNDRGFPWIEISYTYPYPQKSLPLAGGTGFPGVRGRVFMIL